MSVCVLLKAEAPLVTDLSPGCVSHEIHLRPSLPLLVLQDLFVLLDLIGAPSPHFGNQFAGTKHWLSRLQNIGECSSVLLLFALAKTRHTQHESP